MRAAAGIVGAVALALGAGGCASIVSGQRDEVRVESEPSGQHCEVYQGGETVARVVTPQTISVERSSSTLLVTCGSAQEKQESGLNSWTLGNFLFLPVFPIMLVGLGVDWATGADHSYGEDVMVRAVPAAPPAHASGARKNDECDIGKFYDDKRVEREAVVRAFGGV